MNDADTTYQQPVNTFLAITRKVDSESKIVLTESEWAIVKEVRRIKNEARHCQILIGFREERFMLYRVNLSGTFGVDSPVVK